ncbi:MAG: glycosyltransferase family 4 protein [Planctomycetes bacterium]|nr:glycosyltransferase family 4 protein [Planctomycetota bacterium]
MALRVLQLCSAREFIGEAARVVDLAEALVNHGHTAEIIGRKKHSVVEAAGRKQIPYANAHMGSRFNPFLDLKDILLIRRRIRNLNADLVHAHRGKDHWLAAMALSGMKPIPLVRTRHVVTPIRSHAFNKWLFNHRTAGLICASQAVRQGVQSSAPWLTSPVEVIPGGVNLERFRPGKEEELAREKQTLHLKEGAKIVSCLARLAPVKGQHYLLEAIPKVLEKHPGTVFLFAFSRQSEYREYLDSIVEKLGIRDAVRWLGRVERLNLFLQMSDVGVIASIGSEGWSRASVEFMTFSVPMVATSVGSLPEIVLDGQTGMIVPPRDSAALANAITALLDNDINRRQLGEAGRDRVLNNFTRERMMQDVLAFYHKLLGNNG